MDLGKQARISADNFEDNDRLKLEKKFKTNVRELTWSLLPPLSNLQPEKQKELNDTVDAALSRAKLLPPPAALFALMAPDQHHGHLSYPQLQKYLMTAFFRAHILPSLNLDVFDDHEVIDLYYKSDWGFQRGEGFKTDEYALRLPTRPPPTVPLRAQGPRPLLFGQAAMQGQGFVRPPFMQEPMAQGSGVDEFPAQAFPSQERPEGPFPFMMPPTFPFQVPVRPQGFRPIRVGGGDFFPGQQSPFPPPPQQMQGFMPGDGELDFLPPPTLQEEFIARVFLVLSLKLPQSPPAVIEELVSIKLRQAPFPPEAEFEKLLKEGPPELESYLINIFIEAYILQQELNRLPKLRLNYEYTELERAALAGKWEDAKSFLEKQPDRGKAAVAAWVTPYKMTALHVAAFKGHAGFVKSMADFVSKIDINLLTLKDDRGFTVLDYVALNGRKDVAKVLIDKNDNLLNSSVSGGELKLSALSIAVVGTNFGNKSDNTRVLRYLASTASDQDLLTEDLINALVLNGHLDILLFLLGRFPAYLDDTSNSASILMILAQTPSNFFSGSDLGFWQAHIYPYIPVEGSYKPSNKMRVHWFRKLLSDIFLRITPSWINKIQVSKQKHLCAVAIVELVWEQILKKDNGVEECFSKQPNILVAAIKSGIIEILRTTFRSCPELVWIRLRCFLQRNSFLKAAIRYRQEEIFKFLMEDKTCFITESIYTGTSLLHRAAKFPPYLGLSCVSGAAFQMQREMQWFKAMQQFVPPTFRYRRENGLTAEELFEIEHKELAATGETWLKDTSNYCMIVSTLITTVVFASAFTVPGGNTSDGSPIFLWSKAFLVFAVSNALALFSSLMSLLMFLSILTSRFTAEDFLKSLPKRMILGLASLFFAIATMIIAFGAALAIVLGRRLEWVSIPIILLAVFPVSIFGLLQLPLFIQMIQSTYWSTLSTSKSWD